VWFDFMTAFAKGMPDLIAASKRPCAARTAAESATRRFLLRRNALGAAFFPNGNPLARELDNTIESLRWITKFTRSFRAGAHRNFKNGAAAFARDLGGAAQFAG
jgi:hypothetical protein